MRRLLYLLFFMILLLNVNLIESQGMSGRIQTSKTGYDIEAFVPELLEYNQTFRFNFHIFNITNSYPVIDNDTKCDFHLYDNTGEHQAIYLNIPKHLDEGLLNEWEFVPDRNNFTVLGIHHFVFQCNNTQTSLGGFFASHFTVIKSDQAVPSLAQSVLYLTTLFPILIMLIFFAGGFFFSKNDLIKLFSIVFFAILYIMLALQTATVIHEQLFYYDSMITGYETFLFIMEIALELLILISVIGILVYGWYWWYNRKNMFG